MKVLHIATPDGWRGGEQQVAYLALGLRESGTEEAVLCREGSPLETQLRKDKIPVITFRHRGMAGLALAALIRRSCKDSGFDIIHAHDSHAHSAAVEAAVIFGNKTPVVVSRRVDFSVSASFFSRFKYNHPSIRRIICVSEMIRKVTAPAIRRRELLQVVHDGIDADRFRIPVDKRELRRGLGLPDDTLLIGNISALADHKDHPTFIRAASLMLRENPLLHFVLVGKGPEEKTIRSMITDSGWSANIHLLGFRNDVPQVMKSLDLFLMTSSTEGLGSTVLDAFAAEVPVVATTAGGIPELVSDESTGLLAPVKDHERLAAAALRLLSDKSLRETVVRNAAAKVEGFAFREMARKTRAVYEEVLSERGAAV
ncbi:MAG: hypothetical protein RL021_684 [Bacteroidota bacterium]|jgi:glycosyltransferase involved in cell wall biosynthesis